jgi:sugar-specific transcriptional regulator TrmB
MDKEEFKFPDEIDEGKTVDQINQDAEDEGKLEIEIEDDTPQEDRGRKASEPDFVKKLETDELDEYSESAKKKINEFKKVWNDERRAKESALREQQEAISLAQKILEENKKLKSRLSAGDEALVSSFKETADRELDMARKEYREAYDSGDTDKLLEAQEKMTDAKLKLQRVNSFVPQKALQEEEFDVKIPQTAQQRPQPDTKARSWQENNTWFGQDDEMTSLALGLHEKLVKENGMAYATTDEYYKRIDATMRKRFPENFGEEEQQETTQRVNKPSNVVAPATRSTSSKKIKLKASQVQLAKKLGLTPEQYAAEFAKTGA